VVRALLPLLLKLALTRTGAAATECPADGACAVDLERTVAGQVLVVHHQDLDAGRVVSLRIGAVDVGVGLLPLDAAPRVTLEEGTLEDGSAAVAVMLELDGGAIVTACRLGAPACTRPVRVECAASGCAVRLDKGTLHAGARRFRVTRDY
jgi:hypothetical protein